MIDIFLDDWRANHKIEWAPFGDGPWICLNNLCVHYRKPVITACKWHINENNRYVGKFKCKCGMSYLRSFHLSSPADTVTRKIDFGWRWRAKIRSLLKRGMSYGEIAEAVNCHAWKQHYYRKGSHGTPEALSKVKQSKIFSYRAIWRDAVIECPQTLDQVRRRDWATYNFLLRNDREWFITFNKKHRRKARARKKQSLSEKDDFIVRLLEKEFEILSRSNVPRRVTKNMLLNSIHRRSKYVDKFPKVAKFLSNHCETLENYKTRRAQNKS